ncbi:phosphodiester glycosidase family protein [Okeanomitos corallinicola TIOX110]|uniref:Phosphodiester glycosidase family protein n=1 Tax=Okeanomitos corallinicola TIOX110 TaxID=3133117 RepID=A0ABZ2UTZ6_9CYAN
MTIINQLLLIKYSLFPILAATLCFTTHATNAQEYPPKAKSSPGLTSALPAKFSGNQIILNGKTLPGAWLQQQEASGRFITHISDGALRQFLGVDLLNTSNPQLQPVEWFSQSTSSPTFTARLLGGYRYLDISNFAQTKNWQVQVQGNRLVISTPPAKINNIRQGRQSWGDRLVIDLDNPTPWQVTPGQTIKAPVESDNPDSQPPGQTYREWIVTLDSTADSGLIQRYTPQPAPPNQLKQLPSATDPIPLIQKVDLVNNQTKISLSVPLGSYPQIITLANPNRLVVDIRPDALVTKDITWSQGLRWQQKYINLGADKFSVVWLEINPRTAQLKIRPIFANSESQTGIAPLIQTAKRYSAVAGINGGYFNRNNKLPLGAVRTDNQWMSGPILNRGAIAWNDNGEFYFGRLTLTENLTINNNESLPILFLNSGFVQNGIARYTRSWGSTYTPIIDNEIILIVQNNQITNQIIGGKANTTPIPIPDNGYLLTLRGTATNNASKLTPGTKVSISSNTTPSEFNRYPHIIGAGPLLVQNRQIVLNGESEKFSKAFVAGKAVRSGICTTSTGNLIIAATHDRAGGPGPNLAEHAKLMQAMGCVNALNLDGGSSTSLYLGGQLLDRSPNTAARVHNAIGIFLNTP